MVARHALLQPMKGASASLSVVNAQDYRRRCLIVRFLTPVRQRCISCVVCEVCICLYLRADRVRRADACRRLSPVSATCRVGEAASSRHHANLGCGAGTRFVQGQRGALFPLGGYLQKLPGCPVLGGGVSFGLYVRKTTVFITCPGWFRKCPKAGSNL